MTRSIECRQNKWQQCIKINRQLIQGGENVKLAGATDIVQQKGSPFIHQRPISHQAVGKANSEGRTAINKDALLKCVPSV